MGGAQISRKSCCEKVVRVRLWGFLGVRKDVGAVKVQRQGAKDAKKRVAQLPDPPALPISLRSSPAFASFAP